MMYKKLCCFINGPWHKTLKWFDGSHDTIKVPKLKDSYITSLFETNEDLGTNDKIYDEVEYVRIFELKGENPVTFYAPSDSLPTWDDLFRIIAESV